MRRARDCRRARLVRGSLLEIRTDMPTEADGNPSTRVERAHCNECGTSTRHWVVAQRVQKGEELYDRELGIYLYWRTTWTMLECCGCETVCLRRSHWFSEFDPDDGEQVEFYPPPAARRPPRWISRLRDEEQALLEEVYVALQADSRRLAMMGARALVDVVMNRDGDQGSFVAGLQSLERRGLIAARQREVLEAALDVGHAAAHRGHWPTRDDVDTVIDIVEHLLQAELLGPLAADLRTRTPPRRPSSRAGSLPSASTARTEGRHDTQQEPG